MSNKKLKAYVRFDGSGRVVAGSLILRKNKPKVGRWQQIVADECCEPFSAVDRTIYTTDPATDSEICAAWLASTGDISDVVYDTGSLFTATSFTSINIGSITDGDYWISDGDFYRKFSATTDIYTFEATDYPTPTTCPKS